MKVISKNWENIKSALLVGYNSPMKKYPDLQALRSAAYSCLNIPYLYGGQNPIDGFDCSGFCLYMLRCANMAPSKDLTAQGIYEYLQTLPLLYDPSRATLGAFAFYGVSHQEISHIAFCIDNNFIVEAYGDSTVDDVIKATKFNNRNGAFVRVSTLNRRSDLITIIRPTYRTLGEG